MPGKTLQQIAIEFMDEREDQDAHGLDRVYRLALKGLRQLHMRVSGAPSFQMLTIDENTQTINIPDDAIRVILVAKLASNNDIVPLKVKDDMVLNTSPSYGYGKRYENNNYHLGHFFGAPSIAGPSYRDDRINNTLKISSAVGVSQLYVEYLADITKSDKSYIVHPYDEEAILAWIAYADVRNNRTIPLFERREAKRNWDEARKQCRRMHSSTTLKQLMDQIRSSYTGSVRG